MYVSQTTLLAFIFICAAIVYVLWRTVKEKQEIGFALAETLVGMIEAGDPDLDGHSLYVCYLTMLLYEYLPLTKKLLLPKSYLQYASLLLDVGKYRLPRRILNKKGKLAGNEWACVRRHPELGVEALSTVGSFRRISDWILYHHEHVDGSGYYHKKGEEIPLAARMIAVADAYSAMTMPRSYKATRTYEDAAAELKMAAGTQLDAELVALFCEIPTRRIKACAEEVRAQLERYSTECEPQ